MKLWQWNIAENDSNIPESMYNSKGIVYLLQNFLLLSQISSLEQPTDNMKGDRRLKHERPAPLRTTESLAAYTFGYLLGHDTYLFLA